MKIVLIAVGVLFVFGAMAVAGMYYTARHYVKLAENVTGINAGEVVGSIRDAAKHPSEGSSERKRDGCALMSKEEASAILGLEVERIDGKPNDQESGEHCDYFVKPSSDGRSRDWSSGINSSGSAGGDFRGAGAPNGSS